MRLLQLRTVVVAHDLTPTSDAALRTAAAFAEHAGASVHVAHVAPPETGMMAQTGRRSEFMAEIDDAAKRARITTPFTPHVLEGDPAAAMAALAARVAGDVIITGRRAPRVPMDRPLGGTAYAMVTRSLIPCLVVTSPMSPPMRRTVVAIDCSEASRGALLVGLSWASALRGRADAGEPMLTALHVHVGDGSAEQARMKRTVDHELDVLRRHAGDWAGVNVSGITRPGPDTVGAILSTVTELESDLLVLGTRGLGAAADKTLGSVSAAVIGKLQKPVLLVPPAIWRDFAKDIDYL